MSWRAARRERQRERERMGEALEHVLSRKPAEVARERAMRGLEPLRTHFPLEVQHRLADVQLALSVSSPDERYRLFLTGLSNGDELELDPSFGAGHALLAERWAGGAAEDEATSGALCTALYMALKRGHGLGLLLCGDPLYPYWADAAGEEEADPSELVPRLLSRLALVDPKEVLEVYGMELAGALETAMGSIIDVVVEARGVDLSPYRGQLLVSVLTGVVSGLADCEMQEGVFDPEFIERMEKDPLMPSLSRVYR